MTSRVSPNGRIPRVHVGAPPDRLRQRRREQRRTRRGGVPLQSPRKATAPLAVRSCNPDGRAAGGSVRHRRKSGEGPGCSSIDRKSGRRKPKRASTTGSRGASPAGRLRRRHAPYQSRYLSNEGRLFFNSADALVPRPSTNGKETCTRTSIGVENVYEYEPAAKRASAGGCVALISSGTSEHESAFLDASENGNDVFFLTAAQLVAAGHRHAASTSTTLASAEASAPCLPPPPPSSVPCDEETMKPGLQRVAARRPAFEEPASRASSGPGAAPGIGAPEQNRPTAGETESETADARPEARKGAEAVQEGQAEEQAAGMRKAG